MAGACRLDTFAPEVADALRRAPPDLQRRVAEFAANWAVARTGLTHPSLGAGSVDDMAALVAELDDRYFALSEEREAGRASTEDVVAAFGRARAANAVVFMRCGESAEAIYEAAAAAEDWSELRAAVLSQVGSGAPAEPGFAPDCGGIT
jgi:hypothetical protein